MKKAKKILEIIKVTFLLLVLVSVIGVQFYPDTVSRIFGLKAYVVLSNSMEPTIPTYSLVFSRTLPKDASIKKDSIITFSADYLGKKELITHYFRETMVKEDGVKYYRTQPEGIHDQYDSFETRREDVVGVYLFHIPYIGKFFLFLKSEMGLLFLAQLGVILLVNLVIRVKWEEDKKNGKVDRPEIEIKDISLLKENGHYVIGGTLVHHLLLSIKHVRINIKAFNLDGIECFNENIFIVDNKYLHYGIKKEFSYIIESDEKIESIEISHMTHKI